MRSSSRLFGGERKRDDRPRPPRLPGGLGAVNKDLSRVAPRASLEGGLAPLGGRLGRSTIGKRRLALLERVGMSRSITTSSQSPRRALEMPLLHP